jgi:thiamine pyrophosphokinase
MVTAVVFSGGPPYGRPLGGDPPAEATPAVLEGLDVDLVVAADGGLHLARSFGIDADLLVGDMDSVSAELLAEAEQRGVTIERHPAAKEATDLELAMDAAVRRGADRIVVVGSARGRMDHLLGGALVVSSARYAGVDVEAWLGRSLVVPVHDQRTIEGRRGEFVSVMALHGPAIGVSTRGLRWPLLDDRLDPGSSRGISNEFVEATAEVSVARGTVVVVVPEPETRQEHRTEEER